MPEAPNRLTLENLSERIAVLEGKKKGAAPKEEPKEEQPKDESPKSPEPTDVQKEATPVQRYKK